MKAKDNSKEILIAYYLNENPTDNYPTNNYKTNFSKPVKHDILLNIFESRFN